MDRFWNHFGRHLEVQNNEKSDPMLVLNLELLLEGSKGSKRAFMEVIEADMQGSLEAT